MMHSASTTDMGTAELLQRATSDSAELVRLELALARDELRQDLDAAKKSAIFGAAAVVLTLTGLASLVIALGVALGPLGALAVGGGLLATGAVSAFVAYKKFPMKPLAATARRLEDDEKMLKEHVS